jgi:hypothetical protein
MLALYSFGLLNGRNVDLWSIRFGCGHDIRFTYMGNIRNFRFFVNFHGAYKFQGFCIYVVLVSVRAMFRIGSATKSDP